jgi:hypothetical protein
MMCRSRVDHSTLRRKRLAVLSALLLALAMGCGRTCPGNACEEHQHICADAPCGTPPASISLNIQGGFEVLGPQGTGTPPVGWEMLAGDWGIQAQIAEPGLAGERSLRLSQQWPIAVEVQSTQAISRVQNGVNYAAVDLSATVFWPTTDIGGAYLYMGVEWYDFTGAPVEFQHVSISPTIGSTQAIMSADIPPGAATGRVQFRRYSPGYSQPTLDNVAVRLHQGV